jgi:hypothetical protein
VSVAIGNARGTSYRGISQLCLGFAWPDVDTDEGLDAHHDALQKAILNGAALVFQAIDTLLFRFWVLNGIIVPSQGQEIGILNPATGQYEPIRG